MERGTVPCPFVPEREVVNLDILRTNIRKFDYYTICPDKNEEDFEETETK